MHEYHIVSEFINQILDTARNNDASKVTEVAVVLGQHSGVEESSLRLHFETLAQGTSIEDAQLLVSFVKTQLHCTKCNKNFECNNNTFNCPKCGELGSPTQIGKELYIKNIELETQYTTEVLTC
ncbi:MAG: hydrogenase maturation nickel metallochaperone HypA [Candidatus Ancaeobacter aquaticus]|nr:hydrogenase maturation nickel metallochaperone HypA [Candidatus Ancaeobacter aquaticus]